MMCLAHGIKSLMHLFKSKTVQNTVLCDPIHSFIRNTQELAELLFNIRSDFSECDAGPQGMNILLKRRELLSVAFPILYDIIEAGDGRRPASIC